MKEYCNMINGLHTSETAKEILRQICRVACSDNIFTKETIKDIFIASPIGAGLSEYAKTYENLLRENGVFRNWGKATYLELAFPRYGTERDYDRFFQSPRLVAATINEFTGVFLISFEQWSGYSDLIREEAFSDLLKYIEGNKSNISFVFHVLPGFADKERLFRKLNGYVNLLFVELEKPGVREAHSYIDKVLSKAGFLLGEGARERLDTYLLDQIDFNSDAYAGYETLDRLAQSMIFDFHNMCEENGEGLRVVDATVMEQVADNFVFALADREQTKRVGF